MADIDVELLLLPLSDAEPSGKDLAYDPVFQALEAASLGKPEQQFGDTVIAATEPDWRSMHEHALDLASRTHDLRVAVQLMRAQARLSGFVAFASGMALLHGLLERHWATVHPQLDASDHDDPTMRLNALAPLADAGSVLADLRAAPLGPARGSITVRAVELAYGAAHPGTGELVPTQAGAIQGVADALSAAPRLLDAIEAVHAQALGIESIVDAKVGASQAPDMKALVALTRCLAQAARSARGDAAPVAASRASAAGGAAANPAAAAAAAGEPAAAAPGVIASRDDAVEALDRVCDWIERNEPANPAPLLIRRAQRLMNKSFMDIIRDLIPDGVDQVRRIAGAHDE